MSHFLAKSLTAGLLSMTAAAGVVWFGTAPQDAGAVAADHPHPHPKPKADAVDTVRRRDSDSATSRVTVRERDDTSTSRSVLQRMLSDRQLREADGRAHAHDGGEMHTHDDDGNDHDGKHHDGKDHGGTDAAELPRVLELAVRRAERNRDLDVDIDMMSSGDVTVTRTETRDGKQTVETLSLEDVNMDRDAPAIARFIQSGRKPSRHLRTEHDAEVTTESVMEDMDAAMAALDEAMADLPDDVSVDIDIDERSGDVTVTRTVERGNRTTVKRMTMDDADMERDAPKIADFITSGDLPRHLREEHDADVKTVRERRSDRATERPTERGTTTYDGRRRMDQAPDGSELPKPRMSDSGRDSERSMERRMDSAGLSATDMSGLRTFEKTEPTRLLMATRTIEDEDLRDQALFSVVEYALRFDQFDVAEKALQRMEGRDLLGNAHFKVAVRMGEVGNVDGALDEIGKIKSKDVRDIYRMRLVEILATPIEERDALPDY